MVNRKQIGGSERIGYSKEKTGVRSQKLVPSLSREQKLGAYAIPCGPDASASRERIWQKRNTQYARRNTRLLGPQLLERDLKKQSQFPNVEMSAKSLFEED
ncbi:MAG: hypothetical protein JSU70_03685 [Phycisphaerales bacterium]|nr:MAG: hypothetical protein JSU70_03685 [Phycisphaerales bacterium]